MEQIEALTVIKIIQAAGDVSSAGLGYFMGQLGTMVEYDMINGAVGRTVQTGLTITPADLVLCNGGSAVIHDQGSTRFQLVNLNGGFSNYTGAQNPSGGLRDQQMAFDGANTIISTSDVAGRVSRFSTLTFQASSFGITGRAVLSTAVIAKPDTSNRFLVGWRDNTITEIDGNGVVIKTIVTPGIAGIGWVTSMALSDDLLIASYGQGPTFLYKYSTSQLLDNGFGIGPSIGGSDGLCFSPLASGICFASPYSIAGNVHTLQAINLAAERFNTTEVYSLVTSSAILRGIGYIPSIKRGYVMTSTRLVIFKVNPSMNFPIQTRVQEPLGMDVSARIIRIRDFGAGKAVVAFDQTIIAGATSIQSQQSGEYIEVAIYSPSNKADFRRFNI